MIASLKAVNQEYRTRLPIKKLTHHAQIEKSISVQADYTVMMRSYLMVVEPSLAPMILFHVHGHDSDVGLGPMGVGWVPPLA